jgi:hypothetical protein
MTPEKEVPRGHGSKFARKKEAAITALMTQRNIADAARTAGIGTQTLMRWLKVPEFHQAYSETCRAAVSQAAALAQQHSGTAVAALVKISVDPSAPAAARVRAADKLWTIATESLDREQLVERMRLLEQELRGAQVVAEQQTENAPKEV